MLKRYAFAIVLLAVLPLPIWYACSFLPALATMQSSSARGLAALGDAARWSAALAGADEAPARMRTWSIRQSYADAHPRHESPTVWHLNNLLWHGASYLHFNDREMLGIWIDCAAQGCGRGLPYAARQYLGKNLRDISPLEITRLIAYARSPGRNIPTPDVGALTLADRQAIATAVVHEMFTLNDSARLHVALTVRIEGSDADHIRQYVVQSYPASQRFIDEADRIVKKFCAYDRRSALPSLGIGVDLSTMKMPGADSASVTGGSSMCTIGTQESTYLLRRVDGRWQVVKTQQDIVV